VKDYKLVSADAHLETPPDGWVNRLPEDIKDKAPHVVEVEGGGQGWSMDGSDPVPLGLQATGGQKYPEIRPRGLRFDSDPPPPGTGGPERRVAEQEQDGVDAEVLFSSVAVAALRKSGDDDRAVVEMAKAYNDWASEYCSYDPDRLLGIAIMPFTGIADAVKELRRVAELPGLRGAMLLQFPAGEKWLTPDDAEFWAVAEKLNVPIVAHHKFGGIGSPTPMPGLNVLELAGDADRAHFAWLLTCDLPLPTLPIATLLQLMMSGVLDQHPNLKFHFAETGIGWLPHWLEQMEDRYDRHRFWAGLELERRPAQYIRDHFTFSFQEDHTGVKNRHDIGVDNICWASDFPHSVGDWPWSRETVARQLKDVPNNDRRRIQGLNVLVQLGVITPGDRERLAEEPVKPDPEELPARGERRIA
jgi:predicted TIM-barrel fold metal-dependent hydrolase